MFISQSIIPIKIHLPISKERLVRAVSAQRARRGRKVKLLARHERSADTQRERNQLPSRNAATRHGIFVVQNTTVKTNY